MKECYEPGCTVYLSRHNNPARKLKYTLEMTQMDTTLVGINTQVPNHLLKESILNGKVPSLMGYTRVSVKYPTARTHASTCSLRMPRKDVLWKLKTVPLYQATTPPIFLMP